MDDDKTCDFVEREVNITLRYNVCAKHGNAHAVSAMYESGGIDPSDALPDLLGMVEAVCMAMMTRRDGVSEWLGQDWGDDFGTLDEDEQQTLARHFAHQFLLQRVAERSYSHDTTMASMALPFDQGA